MKRGNGPPEEEEGELSALVSSLHQTERRIDELTGGEVDAVLDGEGRSYMLQRAQEQLRCELENRIAARTVELLKTNEVLRASEAEFRNLANAMPQIVWIRRPDGG